MEKVIPITDGEIDVANLAFDGINRTTPPGILPPPLLIALKDQFWHGIKKAWPNKVLAGAA
jgi:hypothetical protein